MIIKISYSKTEALEREIIAIRNSLSSQSCGAYFSRYPTPESYFEDFISKPDGLEVERHLKALGESLRVLDIGAGTGKSSIYLAASGHCVSVVEPSAEACNVIDFGAQLYGLEITVYNSTAEYINKINNRFDVIIFNASLHHCDHPVLALRNCYNILVEGGQLQIVNEPFLPFFRTKRWFYKRLETHPQEMGHYGGNEHSYRYHEYLKMIKLAGFSKIDTVLNIRNNNYNIVLKQIEERKLNDMPIYNTRSKLIRKIYFYSICKLSNSGFPGKLILYLMTRLSLLTTTFKATK